MCFSSSNLANYALDFIWRDFILLFPKTGPKKAERHSNTQICRCAVSIAPQEHRRTKMGHRGSLVTSALGGSFSVVSRSSLKTLRMRLEKMHRV